MTAGDARRRSEPRRSARPRPQSLRRVTAHMTGAVASIVRVSLAAVRINGRTSECSRALRGKSRNRTEIATVSRAYLRCRQPGCGSVPALSILRFVPARGGLYGSAMRGFFSNPRRLLIVIHDLVMTAAAMSGCVLFSFRRHRADAALPLAADRSSRLSGLCRRGLLDFQALCRQVALCVLAGPVEHFSRRDGAGAVAAGARLRAGRAVFLRHVFLRQNHHSSLLGAADVFPRWAAHRLPAVPACAHAAPRQRSGSGSRHSSPGARRTPKFCCAPSRAARSPSCGRSASCRRRAPTRARRCAAFRCAAICRILKSP